MGAVYFDSKRNTHLQRGKAVILAANGAETPRLLLLSTSSQFPNGLANSSGCVGKNLMPNSNVVVSGVFDEALNDYRVVLKNAPDLLNDVVSELQESLSAAPDHPEIHRLLGDARIRQGDYLSALESYNRAVALTQTETQGS